MPRSFPFPLSPDPESARLPRSRVRGRAAGGFTIMEVCVAGAIITIFLSSLFALNSNMVHLLRAASEAANASQNLQYRVEQIRLANWTQITNPASLSQNLFAGPTDAKNNLPGMTETITVSAYVPPTAASATPPSATPSPFTIQHLADDSVQYPTTYTDSNLLAQQEMIRVDLSMTWPSLYRTRTRALSTVVSRWGISK